MKLIQKQGSKEKIIQCKNCRATNFQDPKFSKLNDSQFKMTTVCNECKQTITYIYSNGNEILKEQ